MLSYLEVAKKTAREAGALLMERLGSVREYEYKYKNSMVTKVDVESEKLIVEMLRSHFPDHGMFGEELGETDSESDFRWIIDPVDGTTNYLHAYPYFSVSIGLELSGELQAGVVYDPFKDEMFSAERGGGAHLNGKPISPSRVESLGESLVVTGFTHQEQWMLEQGIEHLVNFMRRTQGFRRDGSAALDLCHVAAGRTDGFWEIGLHAWDIAAGVLILREAGGVATDFSGGALDIYGVEMLASNGRIHEQMVEVLGLVHARDEETPVSIKG